MKTDKFFSNFRDPVSALSHFAGAAAAVVGLLALLQFPSSGPYWTPSLVVYGASLFLLFFASAVYHTVVASPRVVEIFRKIDHAAIYILIAGTYTPFCLNAFSGFWQWGMLVIIWVLAVVGIVGKVFLVDTPRWFTAGVYIVMGWLSLFAAQEILSSLPALTVLWLLAGGVIYTLGAGVYITRRMDFKPGVFGFHEVWHIFVLLGAATHFMAVASLLV